MSTDDPPTLLHDAAAGPVAPLDHDELRRRARGRTRSKWAAAGVTLLAAVVGVGGLVAHLQGPPTVDVVDTPGGTVAPADPLEGLPEFPVTLDLPPVGEVAATHVGERPVFVVHRDTGDVLVLDAVSPHRAGTELPKVVAFCKQPWLFETRDQDTAVETPGTFADLWHASRFALDGSWLGGPAPTGLPRYQVRSVDGGTVDVGPPAPAPERQVGPFEDVLGPRSNSNGRDLSGPSCTSAFDHQNRAPAQPDDQTEVLWHEAQYPDRWLYPFNAASEQTTPDENLEPLVEGEQSTSRQPTEGTPVEAALIILAFVVGIAAFSAYWRRREADGSLDAGPSSVSRPGLRRFFDFGPGGWSEDGKNQPPKE